jgi:hypothetical protein
MALLLTALLLTALLLMALLPRMVAQRFTSPLMPVVEIREAVHSIWAACSGTGRRLDPPWPEEARQYGRSAFGTADVTFAPPASAKPAPARRNVATPLSRGL